MADEATQLAALRVAATDVARRVEAKVVEIRLLADEFRDVLNKLHQVDSPEIQAAKKDDEAAEVRLRGAGDMLDGVAKEVIARHGPGATIVPPKALRDVTNLLLLDHYPKHKKALEEWLRREADLSSRISRKETRSADVTNQIFNIIGWYAVFLGVVLTAVSQLTQTSKENPVPVCGKIWFPIVLTVFGTFVSICGIVYKFKTIKSLEQTIHSEKQTKTELQRRALTLQAKGPQKFSFTADVNDNMKSTSPKSFWKDKILVIASLILFALLFILSYFVILCDTGAVRDWDSGLPSRS